MAERKTCPGLVQNFYGITEFVLGNPAVGRVVEDPDGPRFQNPKQMLSYPGSKFSWTPDLQEAYNTVLEQVSGKPFAHLDLYGGSGIVTYMTQELYGDHHEILTKAVYNDADPVVAGVVRALKEQPGELRRKVRYMMEKVRDNADYFKHLRTVADDRDAEILTRAAAKFVVTNISYLYKGLYYRARMAVTKIPLLENKLAEIDSWTDVFSRVTVWQKPFLRALEDFIEQNPGNRVVFLDPPYLPKKTGKKSQTARDYYNVSMTLAEHVHLAEQFHSGKCTYILTHNDEPAFRAIYGSADIEWTRKKTQKTNTPSVKTYVDHEILMVNLQRSTQ